jgi:hypothetical protein
MSHVSPRKEVSNERGAGAHPLWAGVGKRVQIGPGNRAYLHTLTRSNARCSLTHPIPAPRPSLRSTSPKDVDSLRGRRRSLRSPNIKLIEDLRRSSKILFAI